MRKLQPDEREFIDKLYREYGQQLFRYARTILRDDSIAQEVLQDTFRLACDKINKLFSSENPGGWLMEALNHTIRRAKRTKKQYAKYILQITEEFDFDSIVDDKSPDDDVDILYSDLAEHKEFQLAKKFAVEGKSIKDIAEEENISVEACKQKLYRARIKLRKEIEKNTK